MDPATSNPALTKIAKEVDSHRVLHQLERMLASAQFRSSRRSSTFFRYVVTQTLDGAQESLKERTIGVEVFHRDPTFDTASDCIVRVSASEVRKRIAQYYQEPGKNQELRIELPLGSYVPSFQSAHPLLPVSAPAATAAAAAAPVEPPHSIPVVKEATRLFGTRIWIGLAAVIPLSIAIFLLVALELPHPTSAHTNWLGPFATGSNPTIICLGTPAFRQNQPGAETPEQQAALGAPPMNNTLLTLADATALSRVQGLLAAQHHDSRLQLANATTFDTLRSGPTILIAGLDNPWTLRLTANHRFFFKGTYTTQGSIVDRDTGRQWSVDFTLPFAQRTEDYAIVSITDDETLGRPLLILAGVGPNGTMAASEFLVNKENMAALTRLAPSKWSGKNWEAVIGTTVISGVSGPPRILAARFW